MAKKRTKTGGRKAGTPNKANAEIKDIAREWGPAAIMEAAKLAGLTNDGEGKAESEQARIAALNIILDRAYGKATQLLGTEDGTALVQPIINISVGDERKTTHRVASNGGDARSTSASEAG
mgnify:CR=1 FL=1